MAIEVPSRTSKTFISLAATLIVAAMVSISTYYFASEGYFQLDQKLIRDRVDRFQRTIASEIEHLGAIAFDWSAWDEAFDYIQSPNPNFAKSNITVSSMESMGVHLIAYIGLNGEVLTSRILESAVDENASHQATYSFYDKSHPLIVKSSEKPYSTVVRLGNGIAFAAAAPISKADGSIVTTGRVVLAQMIDETVLKSLSAKTDIEVGLVEAAQIPTISQMFVLAENPSFILNFQGDIAVGYIPLKDEMGGGLGYLKLPIQREVYAYGKKAAGTFAWMSGLLTMLIGVLVFLGYFAQKVTREAKKTIADREQLKALLESIPGYVSWFDKDLRYLGVNNRLARDFGLRPEEFAGKLIGFQKNGSEPEMMQKLRAFYDSDRQSEQAEFSVDNNTGGGRFLVCFEKYLGGKIVIAVGIDITEQWKLEKQIESDRATSVNAARLSALGQMAGGIAHEINNPLAVIQGTNARIARLLKASPDLDKVKESIEIVDKTVWRIVAIIKGLKSIARDGSKDPLEPASLKDIVADVVALTSTRYANHGITLEVVEIPADLHIVCRQVQIGQILTNLLNNSFDATEGHEDRFIKIAFKELDDKVEVQVIDSGSGIPQGVLDKMMTPFFTTKPVGKGTGLGLSISRGIVQEHGGNLEYRLIDSHTAFVITLPKSAQCFLRPAA